MNYNTSRNILNHYTHTTRALFKKWKEVGEDTSIIADLLPNHVYEKRTISRGKNKGKVVITFYDNPLSDYDKSVICKHLTGLPTKDDVSHIGSFISQNGRCMIKLVLSSTAESDAFSQEHFEERQFYYQCHWYAVYKKYAHLVGYLNDEIASEIDDEVDDVADKWYETNKERYVPLTGAEFNEIWERLK